MADLYYLSIQSADITTASGYNATKKAIIVKKGQSLASACNGMRLGWNVSYDSGYGDGRHPYDSGTITYYSTDQGYSIPEGEFSVSPKVLVNGSYTFSSATRGSYRLHLGIGFRCSAGNSGQEDYSFGNGTCIIYGNIGTPTVTFSSGLTKAYGTYGKLGYISLGLTNGANEIGSAIAKNLVEVTDVDSGDVFYLALATSLSSCNIPEYPWNATYRFKSLCNGSTNCTYTYDSKEVGGTLGTTYTAGDLDSDWSSSYSQDGTMVTPVISAKANPLRAVWDVLKNAQYIVISNSSGTTTTNIVTTNANEYRFTEDDVANTHGIVIHGISVPYGVSAKTTANSNQIAIAVSSPSAPTISWDSVGIIAISAVANALKYQVYVDDSLVGETTESTYQVGKLSTGTHSIKVCAIGDSSQTASGSTITICNGTSAFSSALTEVVEKIPATTLNYESGTFSWTAVTGASSYKVSLDESVVQNDTTLTYTPTASSGSVYVVAVSSTSAVSGTTCTYYSDSDKSNEIGFGTLAAPVITKSDNVISWSAVTNADSYYIYEDEVLIITTNELSYASNEIVEGTHTFKVKAYSSSPTIEPSAYSNEVTITWTKLAKPIIVNNIDGDKVVVSGAYDANCTIKLDINNRSLSVTADNSGEQSIDISSKNIKGENLIRCRVFSSSALVLPSEQSDSLYFMVTNNDTVYYKAFIAGIAYGIQLPISITETMDETLDTGSCILNLDDTASLSEPMEAYQRILIVAYNPDGSEKTRWNFLIENDKVQAKQFGEDVKYLHTITLIELTKELQQVIMPDLAITQPLSLAGKVSDEVEVEDFDLKNYWINSNGYAEDGRNDKLSGALHSYAWRLEIGAEENGSVYSHITANGLLTKVAVGYSCILPDWEISGIDTVSHHRISWTLGINFTDYYDDKKYFHPHKRWFIRKRTTEAVWTRAEALNAIHNNQSAFIYITDDTSPISQKSFRFTEDMGAGYYDIYLYADPIYDARINKYMYQTEDENLPNSPNLVGMYSKSYSSLPEGSSSHSYEFLYCYTTQITDVVSGDVEEGDEDAITIGKALDKVVSAVEPQRIVNGSLVNPKYSWSLSGHANELCDEATWSGGKSLYEILLDIGRQFGGVPRLNADYSISYDIMGETCKGNTAFIDQDNLTTGESSMDNHASALITQAKNIISSNHWETYPYKGGWVALKSSDDSSVYVTRANSCIKLPHKIHQIKSIECMDLKHGSREFVIYQVGSTQMCLESAMWNLLPETIDGKGSCLCYTRGDDKILNIGCLAPESSTESYFGLASGVYVIGEIINILSGGDIPASDVDPNELVFRVVYRPYIDETIKAEQPDQSSEKAHSISAFNQDANTVSDKRLGNVMEDKASRLGNNSFQKMTRFDDVNARPTIGQTKTVSDCVYYADKINTIIERTYCEATVSYTKNRNNIDPTVGVSSEYRQYEINSDNYVRRQISVDQYAIVSYTKYAKADTALSSKSDYGMTMAIYDFFNAIPLNRPTDFYITCNDVTMKTIFRVPHIGNGNVTKLMKFGTSMIPTTILTSPTIRCTLSKLQRTMYGASAKSDINYGFALHAEYKPIGNSITFFCEAADNYSFGTCATQQETNADPNAIAGSGKYIVRDVRYVDDLGRCPEVSIALGTIDSNNLYWSPSSFYEQYSMLGLVSTIIGRRLPLAEYSDQPLSYMKDYLLNAKFYVNKDNREALSFQYAMHFISFSPSIRVRPALASHIYMPDNGVQGSISLVYLKSDPMTKEALSSSDYDKSSVGTLTTHLGNTVTIMPGASSSYAITPTSDYWGWAYVINDGKVRPMIVVKQAMSCGVSATLHQLVITTSDSLPDWRSEN